MASSPSVNASEPVRIVVLSNGTALPDDVRLISVTVQRSVNAVPSARLVIEDGDMPSGSFPVGDQALLVPGAALVIKAGYGDDEQPLFEGVVVRMAVKISGDNFSRLVIECRDKAVKMTVGRSNANYLAKTDSDIISALIGAHGLAADVEATTESHGELVQHYCSDWDFMLARAEVNGKLVIVGNGQVSVKAPATTAASVLSLSYGSDLMAFDAELDARTQLASVRAVSWDTKTQAVLGQTAAPPNLVSQGNLAASALAQVVGLGAYRLQTSAELSSASLTTWAKARQVKADLARVRGRMTFQGSALAVPGCSIDVAGVGDRFSGKVFAAAVHQQIADGNWTTEVEFGLAPDWFMQRDDVLAPAAAGLAPGVRGLQIGVVEKLDEDPDGAQRIRVNLPVTEATTTGVWARLAQFHASNTFGAFFLPEIGDEVILGYFNDDPSNPVVLGSLYSGKRSPPYALAAANNTKAIVTRCKSKLEFDEENKVITITTPGTNKLVFSDKDKSILMTDQNGNKVELAPGGITLDSPKDITINAKGTITISAVGKLSLSSKADVAVAGLNIVCEAQIGFTGKGAASAELSASGQTTVKGAMVMIN